MKNINTKVVKSILATCAVLISFFSCKKEYEQQKLPFATIESFELQGYFDSSIKALIVDEEIKIFWAEGSELPKTITPKIKISEKSTISPASGETVPFNEETVYTVTAEDGTIKTYKLKPLINIPIPRLTSIPASKPWAPAKKADGSLNSIGTIKITGEYLLSNGESKAKVYMQRVADGREFDLEIDDSKTSMTSLTVLLPEYTAEQDTGLHRLYVEIAGHKSNAEEIQLKLPTIGQYTGLSVQDITPEKFREGDRMTVSFQLENSDDPIVSKVISQYKISQLNINMGAEVGITSKRVSITEFTIEKSKQDPSIQHISFEFPKGELTDNFINGSISYIQVQFSDHQNGFGASMTNFVDANRYIFLKK